MTIPDPPRIPRIARRAAAAAVWAVRPGDPVTGPHAVVAEPAAEHVRRVLDLALRIAETYLSCGASANDTVDAALRITRAYGVRGVHVDVTFTAISLSLHHGPTKDPLTVMRVVRVRGIDYRRLQRLRGIVVAAGEGLSVEDARRRYDAVMKAAPPYRRWVRTTANGLVAAGVCLLFAAAPVIALVAALASAAIDLLQGVMLHRRLPPFFAQALGAAIPTTAGVLMTAGVLHGIGGLEGVRPSLVVVAGIVLMLSGLSTVGAAQDAIDGFYVTAGARAFEVLMMTLGIVVGIMATLQLAHRAGVGMSLSAASPALGPVPLQLLGATVIAAMFSVSVNAGPRTVLTCSVMGLLGWLGFLGAGVLGFGEVGASAIGAAIAGFVASLLAQRFDVPSLALSTAAIVPLMPGSMVFRGLLQLALPGPGQAALLASFVTLFTAASIGVALAAGVSLGTYLARPLSQRRTRSPQQTR